MEYSQPSAVTQIQAIFSELQSTMQDDLASPDRIIGYLHKLTGWLAYSNEQMALMGRTYNIAKRDAYLKLMREERAGDKRSPMLAKDYVASLCSKEALNYDLAERCSRTITHTIDALRTVLSTLRAEMQQLQYAGG